MIRIVVFGGSGRMGHAVAAAAAAADDLEIKARVVSKSNFSVGDGVWTNRAEEVVEAGDVVVDFSRPAATAEVAATCADRGAGLVSGTTGLSVAEERAVREAASQVAVFRAANFSLGVMALRHALRAVLGVIPASWDIEIVERHHRGKVDSPSGTALALVEDLSPRHGTEPARLRHGREGRAGPRTEGEIGVHAVRGGTWVGDHAVLFGGEGESLELRHVAQDRSAFAMGALEAARFVAKSPPGLYTMENLASQLGRVK